MKEVVLLPEEIGSKHIIILMYPSVLEKRRKNKVKRKGLSIIIRNIQLETDNSVYWSLMLIEKFKNVYVHFICVS